MNAPDFWDSQTEAQKVVSELKLVKAQTDPIGEAMTSLEDAKVAYEMAREEGDDDLLVEADDTLFDLTKKMDKIELQSLLSGKHDHRNCFLSISAGDGGTEANDWADMLLRMYLYYFEKQGWKVEEVSKTFGTEVGVDHVTLHVQGPYAFGYLNCERGTHRLARVSPFNAQGKRQTSFATVDVTPEFDETGDVEIPDKDLEITAFARSSGPGGQNVNKVASAIRLVHKPTGFMVVASSHRDQLQNKRQAMALLTAKLEQLEEEKREAEIAEASGGKLEHRGWGAQIRSYVLYDNRVKDHRTNHEVGNPQTVLDGNLQEFIDSELQRRRSNKG
ncbi:MAG: peptide chain release factor 2 [Phycisphaera sp.]|nr:MAG: peptide chain release factor 2 [Phycisphaera sp.]